MTVFAEIITEATRTTLSDVGLILGAATAVGAVGLRWLRREIRNEVSAQTSEIHKAITDVRDEVRRDLRPNGGSSGADAIAQRTAHLVMEMLRRSPDDPT